MLLIKYQACQLFYLCQNQTITKLSVTPCTNGTPHVFREGQNVLEIIRSC